ncbi:hypothetical protein [Acetilactobacillus jinshanensis]|uniref:Uncharacterized protein n=1 Tax=Acetilactobacillus jinshanensis TaxID=1720083 RepID=A0A4P6ZNC5_9LACO|nr:hypothetical protein [Acetilactobacillus jinshanensis]QBP18932.1 hypothetical protein ELX58_07540 [Acetilactobacillus jinshanensis]URL60518.1 hypothetical protein HGK75_00255 [uncultured bacterium]
MDRAQIRQMHLKQNRVQKRFKDLVRKKTFVYHGSNPKARLQAKLYFLRQLKQQLKSAFCFNDYQAEFIKNEAMNRVLRHSPERILVAEDTTKAEKLVKASFVLGHHYFRFIMTML